MKKGFWLCAFLCLLPALSLAEDLQQSARALIDTLELEAVERRWPRANGSRAARRS